MYLRFGDKGDKVKELQIALGDLEPDGHFGRMTEAAVKNWQKKNGMFPDGVATPPMLETLLKDDYSTDASERFQTVGGILIDKYYMPRHEYVSDKPTKKEYLFLHHTAGNHNPYATVDGWVNDNRGRIGTQYVVGGIGVNGDAEFDGRIVETFPDKDWAYHLGAVDRRMHSHSVGIEICNYGWLDCRGGGYFTWSGQRIPLEQVHKLPAPFRGYQSYHNYTDKQIDALQKLIPYIAAKHDIEINLGLPQWLKNEDTVDALEYRVQAVAGKVKGLLSHTNVRTDKTDVYPHNKLMNYLRRL